MARLEYRSITSINIGLAQPNPWGGGEEFESSRDEEGGAIDPLSPEINHVFCHPILQFLNVTLISLV